MTFKLQLAVSKRMAFRQDANTVTLRLKTRMPPHQLPLRRQDRPQQEKRFQDTHRPNRGRSGSSRAATPGNEVTVGGTGAAAASIGVQGPAGTLADERGGRVGGRGRNKG